MTILLLSILLQDYWISELGSDDIDRRDQITQILLSRGRWDSLYAARKKTRDSEVRARLDLVLRAWWKPLRYGIGLPTTSIRWSWTDRYSRFVALLHGTGLLEIHRSDLMIRPFEAFDPLDPTPFVRSVGFEVVRVCTLAMKSDLLEMVSPRGREVEYGGNGISIPQTWSVTYRSGTGAVRHFEGSGMILERQWPLYDELRSIAWQAMLTEFRSRQILRWVRELELESTSRDAAPWLIATGAEAIPALRAAKSDRARYILRFIENPPCRIRGKGVIPCVAPRVAVP